MHKEFKMSLARELNFFLGANHTIVKGIFIMLSHIHSHLSGTSTIIVKMTKGGKSDANAKKEASKSKSFWQQYNQEYDIQFQWMS